MKKIILAVIATAAVASASARPPTDIVYYVPDYKSGIYKGSINYNGSSSTLVSNDMANSSAPLTAFVNGLDNAYWGLRDQLTAQLAGAVASAGGTLNDPGGLTGDISLGITGLADGNVKVTAGDLEYSQSSTFHTSSWGLSVTCTVWVKLKNLRVEAVYNPYTGAIIGGAAASYTPAEEASCSTSLDWMPVIGDFLSNYAAGYVRNSIHQAALGWMNQSFNVSGPGAIFGFANAIEPGKYMVGSFDAGMYVKNNLQSLTIGKSINVFLANKYKYEPHNQASQVQPDFSVQGTVFSVEFCNASGACNANDRIGFQVDSVKTYGWKVRVIPGTNPGDD